MKKVLKIVSVVFVIMIVIGFFAAKRAEKHFRADKSNIIADVQKAFDVGDFVQVTSIGERYSTVDDSDLKKLLYLAKEKQKEIAAINTTAGVYLLTSMPSKYNLRVVLTNGTFTILADDLSFKGYSTNNVGCRGAYTIRERSKDFDGKELNVRYESGYGKYRDTKKGDKVLEKKGYITSDGLLCIDERDVDTQFFRKLGSPVKVNKSSEKVKPNDGGEKSGANGGASDNSQRNAEKFAIERLEKAGFTSLAAIDFYGKLGVHRYRFAGWGEARGSTRNFDIAVSIESGRWEVLAIDIKH